MNNVDVLENLEEVLEDDLHCEMPHRGAPPGFFDTPCSIVVTHRTYAGCSGKTRNVCENMAIFYHRAIDSGGKCNSCGKPCRDHWEVRPI